MQLKKKDCCHAFSLTVTVAFFSYFFLSSVSGPIPTVSFDLCCRSRPMLSVSVVSVIVKHPVLPASVVDGCSRNLLYYYYYCFY